MTEEQMALGAGALELTRAVAGLTEKWETIVDVRTRAAALTIAVITVEDYLNMVDRRLQEEAWGMEDEPDDRTSDQGQNQEGDAGEYPNRPEDGHRHELYLDREIREPDDPDPETVRGREDLGKAHKIALYMTARSMTALAQAQLQSGESDQDPQEWTLLKALASTAARTGNAAALTHHLEMLTAPGRSLSQRAGEVLASWPSQENLIDSSSRPAGQRPEPTGEEPCPGFEEATQASTQAITLLMSADVIGDAEEAHIVQASPLAQEAHNNGDADYILGLLWGNLGNSRAMYEWENDDHQVIMAYRFQGMTYIKLLEEAYQHPIRTEEALEHCNELEEDILELQGELDWDSEEENQDERDTHRQLLEANLQARGMILAGMHQCPDLVLEQFMGMLADLVPEQDRCQQVIAAVCNDWQGPREKMRENLEERTRQLTQRQARNAIEAAREEGADEGSLDHMASLLKMTPGSRREAGLPEPERIPWKYAQGLLLYAQIIRGGTDRGWY